MGKFAFLSSTFLFATWFDSNLYTVASAVSCELIPQGQACLYDVGVYYGPVGDMHVIPYIRIWMVHTGLTRLEIYNNNLQTMSGIYDMHFSNVSTSINLTPVKPLWNDNR